MIIKDIERIRQAIKVIEGQLLNLQEVTEMDPRLEDNVTFGLIEQSMTIIVMAVNSIATKQ